MLPSDLNLFHEFELLREILSFDLINRATFALCDDVQIISVVIQKKNFA